MNTERLVLADEVWEKVSPHLPGKATDCGVTAADNRLFLEAVLWRVRTGSPWRDLVENYFAKIKEYRGIATRYDKTDTSYGANLNLVATVIALR